MTIAADSARSRPGYLVKRVQAALRATMDDALRPLGLGTSQYAILEALYETPDADATNAAIARRCFITPQSANEMISTMIENRLVLRRSSTATPRITFSLTKRGRDKCIEARDRVFVVEERMLAGTTRADRKHLVILLDRCARALERQA